MRGDLTSRGFPGVLLLLLVVVIVPTAGVVWFMTAAVRNERAAVRETLTTAYEVRLTGRVEQVEALWEARRARLEAVGPDDAPAEVFASLVRDGVAESVIVFGEEGTIRYPGDSAIRSREITTDSAAWVDAERLEFGAGRYATAAQAYGNIARGTDNVHLAARALQAQARCLGKAGRQDEATAILTDTLTEDRYHDARDGQGRLIVPNSLLLALHLLADRTSETGRRAAGALRTRLADYGEPAMPVAQRRFLMQQLQDLLPDETPVDTFAAEQLADRYLESDTGIRPGGGLSATALPEVWQLASGDGRVVALLHEAFIRTSVNQAASGDSSGDEIHFELVPPGSETDRQPFLTRSTGAILPGWRVALHLADRQAIDSAANEEIAGYLWTGTLLIAVAVIFSVLVVRSLGRQMRLANLKNDLVATVTHELKTPLASMRLLVDTLLDGEHHDDRRTREYLELISKENTRLSRLIEDFLGFSRMERNKQTFEMMEMAPGDVAVAAAEAVRGRFDGNRCRFDVEIAEGLPPIVGDSDALSTVLVNLLDNAYKYTSDDKEIVLRAYSENGQIVFAVQDNGIGLSGRSAKRVFNRFYQIDEGLSRSGSGVGLGLAIVKFIVDAHKGEVSVASRPGEGSTFMVRLPTAGRDEPLKVEGSHNGG